jgi:hypothetical protein
MTQYVVYHHGVEVARFKRVHRIHSYLTRMGKLGTGQTEQAMSGVPVLGWVVRRQG